MQAWSKFKKTVVISAVVFFGLVGIGAAQGGKQPIPPAPPASPTHVNSKVTTKSVTTTETIPFETQNINDTSLASGTTQIRTEGVSGVKTKTWKVTYTDGIETNRSLVNEEVTTAPIAEVIAHGTYVAPLPCGGYINVDGICVESPDSNTNGASALCVDGTYSHSLHRSGTCSHHGGVAEWL